MSTVLVTGAQGLLGRYFVAAQLRLDDSVEIFGIGRSKPCGHAFSHNITLGHRSCRAPLPAALAGASESSRYRYRSIDVCDEESLRALLAEVRPAAILHLASGLRDDPTGDLFRTNVLGTESLYRAARGADIEIRRIVVVTSGSIYGPAGDELTPSPENAPVAPFDAYSISKYAQERMAMVLGKRLQIPTVVARVFNVVAPGQDERHLCGSLASQLSAIEAGLVAPAIRLEPAVTTRDFIDARDVARYLARLLTDGNDGEIYNVGTGIETPIDSVVRQLISLAALVSVKTELKPPRPADMARNVADTRKLVRLAGAPLVPLSDSLTEVLNYYRWCHATL